MDLIVFVHAGPAHCVPQSDYLKCDNLHQLVWRVSVAPRDLVTVAVHWVVFAHTLAIRLWLFIQI